MTNKIGSKIGLNSAPKKTILNILESFSRFFPLFL